MIQLNSSCITNVPLYNYPDDFSFIVNGTEYKTSRIISDLLSPVICGIHSCDPTISTFTMNTKSKGNFSHILDLAKFKQINISEIEIPFVSEVIEILGNKSIIFDDKNEKIRIDNVFKFIKEQEKKSNFFSKQLLKEINFISSHFYEICESHFDEFERLSYDTLFNIIDNEKLELNSEDQLLFFINKLYATNSDYSTFYDNVLFENVSTAAICDFISIFKIDDINQSTWNRITARLEQDMKSINENTNSTSRYRKQNKNMQVEKVQNENKNNRNTRNEQIRNENRNDRNTHNEQIRNDRNTHNEQIRFENRNDRFDHLRNIYENIRNNHVEREQRNNIWYNLDIRQESSTNETMQVRNVYRPQTRNVSPINTERAQNEIPQDSTNLNQTNTSQTTNVNETTFKVSDQDEFKGIINYLKTHNNRIQDVLSITASSTLNQKFSHYNVIDFDDRTRNFQSKDIKNSWICFDFKNRQVIPTDYAIRSRSCNEDSSHPKSWVIEGSNNKTIWEILDIQNDCEYLKGFGLTHTFSLNRSNGRPYRYIRMRLTGKDWQGANILMINSFEIYGNLT